MRYMIGIIRDAWIRISEGPFLVRGWVNKDHQVRLSLLVNEKHTLAKAVRCGLDIGLGVQVLRPTLFEVLICVGKLTGGERFTIAGCHYDAHSGSFFDNHHQAHRVRRRAGFYTRPFLSSGSFLSSDSAALPYVATTGL